MAAHLSVTIFNKPNLFLKSQRGPKRQQKYSKILQSHILKLSTHMVVIRSNTKAATLNAENCSQFPVPKLSTSMVIVKGSGPYQKKKPFG